jgi:molybdopterin synthase sulfur carrier subunit
MATVWIPALLRDLTEGQAHIEAFGNTVREVIDSLNTVHPGLRDRLCEGDRLSPGIAVAIDGRIAPLQLLASVTDQSEIHFLPSVGGG